MKKLLQIITLLFISVTFSIIIPYAFAADAPTISATALGPNQINLTWAAVPSPGWGYKVEIQSDSDTRYLTWLDLTNALINGYTYLHPWVTEDHYRDRANGSGTDLGTNCQFPVFGLKYGTTYNFRVRCYAKTDSQNDIYGPYSPIASATTITPSAIYYVKQGGNGNGTSESQPWGHIYNANRVACASPNGTLVIIHGGDYSADFLKPDNSGLSQFARIIYQVAPGEIATITSISVAARGPTIDLGTRSHIVIDGLVINDFSGTVAEVIRVRGSRNVFANTKLNGPAWNFSGYGPFIYGTYNLFHQNYWKNYGTNNGENGSVFTLTRPAAYNVVQYCRHEMGGHDTAIVNDGCHHNAVLNCLMDGGGGQAFNVIGNGASYNLFEGNIAKDSGKYITSYKPVIQISADHTTVRRNVIYSGAYHGIEFSSLGGGSSTDNKVYNNVVFGNSGGAIWFMAAMNTNNEIVNNIMYNNGGNASGSGYPTPTDVLVRGTYAGTIIHNNIILHKSGGVDDPGATIISINEANNRSVANANTVHAVYFHDNKTTPPAFVDATTYDFHLKSSSYGVGLAEAVVDWPPWGNVIGAGDALGAFESRKPSVKPNAPRNLVVK